MDPGTTGSAAEKRHIPHVASSPINSSCAYAISLIKVLLHTPFFFFHIHAEWPSLSPPLPSLNEPSKWDLLYCVTLWIPPQEPIFGAETQIVYSRVCVTSCGLRFHARTLSSIHMIHAYFLTSDPYISASNTNWWWVSHSWSVNTLP